MQYPMKMSKAADESGDHTVTGPAPERAKMKKDYVSFIILNWNNKKTIFECLDSLLIQTYPSLEMIVVDNGSVDRSVDMIEKRYGTQIQLIRNPKNLGFAGGVNRGLEAVQGEYVALLNSDATLEPEWTQEMVKGIQQSSTVGMCACKTYLAGQKTVLDNTGEVICRDCLGLARGRLEKDLGQYDRSDDVLCPSGCAALYRKKMLEDIGGLDKKFFAYAEDIEIGIKGRWLGYTCRYIPTAVAYHHLSRSSGVLSSLKAYGVERNRLWIMIKCFPIKDLLLSFFYTALRYFYHAYGMVIKKGPASEYARQFNFLALPWIVLRAHLSTLYHLKHLLSERARFRRKIVLSPKQFEELLKKYTVSAKQAALHELK